MTSLVMEQLQAAGPGKVLKSDIRRERASDIRKSARDVVPVTWFGERFTTLGAFIRSEWFESIIGIIIVLNCCTMYIEINGLVVEQEASLEDFTSVMEQLFTFAFVGEFFLRGFFLGWAVYIPGMSPAGFVDALANLFDAMLVWLTGVGLVWFLPLIGVDAGQLRTMTVLRAFRLLRLVKIVRTSPAFAEVYMLVRGLMESLGTLTWTVLIIFFITYVFAVFGVVTISVDIKQEYERVAGLDPSERDAQEFADLLMVHQFTSSITQWMYTLIQVNTLDSWNAFVRPLMKHSVYSWILIYAYICIAVIVFMNLVTAVIVDGAMQNHKDDESKMLSLKEEEDAKQWRLFRLLFTAMDQDADGSLTVDEFKRAFAIPEVTNKLKLLNFKESDCQVLFDLLDTGDGSLSLEEFLEGLQSMKGRAQAKQIFRTRKIVERIWNVLSYFGEQVGGDFDALFQGMGFARKPREHTILHRAKQQQQQQQQQQPTGSTPSSPAEQGQPPTQINLPPQSLGTELAALRSRIEKMGAEAGQQMENIARRLDIVEARNAGTVQLVQQFAAWQQGGVQYPTGASRSNSYPTSAFAPLPAVPPPGPIAPPMPPASPPGSTEEFRVTRF
eukprot:TRINITY_DN176_c1_g1_i6.p1 TRINITY_DN176_c1_g1~~TRINITY_DN176_c1_g1_i6.p1  ORF type:complete len:613 (-),score=114.30 TRINITY_DN176_c1_g1_i6:30-1868(-)